jgi:hypothetical protein
LFQYHIWEIALVTLLLALTLTFGPLIFQSKEDFYFSAIVFAAGSSIRFFGWRLARVFTLLGRYACAWLFSAIGCAIAILIVNFAKNPRPMNDFLVESWPTVIIGGIWFGFVVEMVFLGLGFLLRLRVNGSSRL